MSYCYCHHMSLRDDLITAYIVESDGTVWAEYAACPTHGGRACEVFWSPVIAERETATVIAVAVQLETS